MNLLPRFRGGIGLACAILLLLGAAPSADAQKVPISFDDYHGYTGTVDYLQKVARAYGDITELVEIGKSNMGRSMYVLVISNMKNGTTIDRYVPLTNKRKENVDNVPPMKSYHGKPGMWIDGGTHGNEYTGTEVTLYIIDKLLTGYDKDPAIKKLIDENAFYCCPIVNPDGVYNSTERGISQRQNSMMVDDDEDGKINEDGPDDMNGDGKLTSFRYKSDRGRYVISPDDPRLMIRFNEEEHAGMERYNVVSEGTDEDGDGEINEDGERGIDVNRNFPEGWFNDEGFRGGSGFYQGSSPEAHAILEYFTNTRNILFVQSFHTSGGFTYRPFARWPDSQIPEKDLAIFDRVMGAKYLELHGEEVPDAWKASAGGTAGRAARAGQGRAAQGTQQPTPRARQASGSSEMPQLWHAPYRGDRPYGYGIFIDWAFAQYGAYSMTTELWNWQRDTKLPGYNNDDDRVAWEKAALNAFGDKYFVSWKRYNHPQHGEGEVGGWISTYSGGGNAFPGESLTGIADIHWQFELFKAGLLPNVQITDAKAEVLYTTGGANSASVSKSGDSFTVTRGAGKGGYKIVKVTATVENTGKLATQRTSGDRLAGNRADVIWLIGDRNKVKYLQGSMWERIGVLEGTLDIPGMAPSAPQPGQRRTLNMQNIPAGVPMEMMRQFMQQGSRGGTDSGSKRELTWLVAVEGDTPLKLVLSSQKGGTRVRDLSIR